jgi:RHS repeat-associated protein
MQGAGGVGGLLGVKGTDGVVHFASYDGNGNVMGLVDGTSGQISAQYEYGPFGEVVRVSGVLAKANPFRFSTKYLDGETGLLYYGHRYYSSDLGRWLSRDPIEEHGGLALYAFAVNSAINGFDLLGLKGNGHHVIPWSIFNGAVREEVQRFFDSDLSRIFNEYYNTHGAKRLDGISAKQYNKLVSAELEKFLGKQALKDMTLAQAEQFLSRILSMPADHPISVYNNAVRRDAAEALKHGLKEAAEKAAASSLEKATASGARKGGSKLAKGVPLVGTVVAIYFYAEDADVYGSTPALVNTAVDAIPLVGAGKLIAETYHGYRFLDVTVGPKQVQPAEGGCSSGAIK